MQKVLDPVVRKVLDAFGAAYDAKESLGLHSNWRTFEDYVRGEQNPPESEEDPGSVTNIIFPILASQISDLVDEPLEVMVIGEEPSDQVFAEDVRHILEWIQFRNRLTFKLDRAEWRRLKFGTCPWKVYYEPPRLGGNGSIIIEPISPVNVFPDPKIKEPWQLNEGDFIIHAMWKPINWLKAHPVYGENAKDLKPMQSSSYNITIFEGEDSETTRETTANRAFVIEIWMRGEKGQLVRKVIANETKLYDSEKDPQFGDKSFYEHGRYPFVFIPCYQVEGRLWGMGDVELLIPTQDLVNDLDDQIRMNARLMGNIQIVVGMASGINPKKWTNRPGLKIPARDDKAWSPVQPPNLPSYIIQRRIQAMQEAEIISGRPDVVEGRRPSGLRAASAILALQEAGNRRARHKKLFLQEGLSQIFELCVDYLKEFFTVEQAFRVLGKDPSKAEYIWFRGSKLKSVPKLVPGSKPGQLVPLVGENGEEVTKEAQFDIRVSVGAGLPHNKAFLYQTIIELVNIQVITREEARIFLRDLLDWPVANPLEPIGNNFVTPNPGVFGGGESQRYPDNTPLNAFAGIPNPAEIPPDLLEKFVALLGGSDAGNMKI